MLETQKNLNQRFGEIWMGANEPIRWPPRFRDLTPLDFSVYAFSEDRVYMKNSTEYLYNYVIISIQYLF